MVLVAYYWWPLWLLGQHKLITIMAYNTGHNICWPLCSVTTKRKPFCIQSNAIVHCKWCAFLKYSNLWLWLIRRLQTASESVLCLRKSNGHQKSGCNKMKNNLLNTIYMTVFTARTWTLMFSVISYTRFDAS